MIKENLQNVVLFALAEDLDLLEYCVSFIDIVDSL